MQGKNILVTGASSGIGKETALYLAKQGATVILAARNQTRLKEVKDAIGEHAYSYICDLSQLESIKGIFEFCKENGLKLDGMVHAAGFQSDTGTQCFGRKHGTNNACELHVVCRTWEIFLWKKILQ